MEENDNLPAYVTIPYAAFLSPAFSQIRNLQYIYCHPVESQCDFEPAPYPRIREDRPDTEESRNKRTGSPPQPVLEFIYRGRGRRLDAGYSLSRTAILDRYDEFDDDF